MLRFKQLLKGCVAVLLLSTLTGSPGFSLGAGTGIYGGILIDETPPKNVISGGEVTNALEAWAIYGKSTVLRAVGTDVDYNNSNTAFADTLRCTWSWTGVTSFTTLMGSPSTKTFNSFSDIPITAIIDDYLSTSWNDPALTINATIHVIPSLVSVSLSPASITRDNYSTSTATISVRSTTPTTTTGCGGLTVSVTAGEGVQLQSAGSWVTSCLVTTNSYGDATIPVRSADISNTDLTSSVTAEFRGVKGTAPITLTGYTGTGLEPLRGHIMVAVTNNYPSDWYDNENEGCVDLDGPDADLIPDHKNAFKFTAVDFTTVDYDVSNGIPVLDGSTGLCELIWTEGDTELGRGSQLIHFFTTQGTHTITLTVKDPGIINDDTDLTATINVVAH